MTTRDEMTDGRDPGFNLSTLKASCMGLHWEVFLTHKAIISSFPLKNVLVVLWQKKKRKKKARIRRITDDKQPPSYHLPSNKLLRVQLYIDNFVFLSLPRIQGPWCGCWAKKLQYWCGCSIFYLPFYCRLFTFLNCFLHQLCIIWVRIYGKILKDLGEFTW